MERGGAAVLQRFFRSVNFQEALNGFLEEEGKPRHLFPTLTIWLHRVLNVNLRQGLCLLKFDRKN